MINRSRTVLIFVHSLLLIFLTGCFGSEDLQETFGSVEIAGLDFQGHEVGNGGDEVLQKNAAWFRSYGRTALPYCINLAEDFGVGRAEVKAQFEQAFAKWIEFAKSAQVSQVYSAQLAERTNCDDGDIFLKLHMGKQPNEVEEVASRYGKNVGFARQTKFSKPDWTPGFLYLSKGDVDWSDSLRLHGAFLHLLGHVFGTDHHPDTVMSDRFFDTLVGPMTDELKWKLVHINHERSLIAQKLYSFKAVDSQRNIRFDHKGSVNPEGFKLLTGLDFDPNAEFGVELYRDPTQNKLHIKAQGASLEIPVTIRQTLRTRLSSHVLQTCSIVYSTTYTLCTSKFQWQYTYVAEVSTYDGAVATLLIEMNTQSHPLKIQMIINGKPYPLLASTLSY